MADGDKLNSVLNPSSQPVRLRKLEKQVRSIRQNLHQGPGIVEGGQFGSRTAEEPPTKFYIEDEHSGNSFEIYKNQKLIFTVDKAGNINTQGGDAEILPTPTGLLTVGRTATIGVRFDRLLRSAYPDYYYTEIYKIADGGTILDGQLVAISDTGYAEFSWDVENDTQGIVNYTHVIARHAGFSGQFSPVCAQQVINTKLIKGVDLEETGVTPGSYDNANVTVDIWGRITDIETGGSTEAGNKASFQLSIQSEPGIITTGPKPGHVRIPYNCTLNKVTIVCQEGHTSSASVDVEMTTFANYPASFASITGSSPPTISAAYKAEDSTLTGWDTSFAVGDMLRLNVLSNDDASELTLAFFLTKT